MAPNGSTEKESQTQQATGPQGNPAQTKQEIIDLQTKIAALGSDVEKLKKSDSSLFKKVAAILGVVGGLIAIPKGVMDSVSAIHQKPRTTVDWGQPLSIHYDAKTRLLRFGFPMALNNLGNADDMLERISADIHTVPDKTKFAITISDFELTLGAEESTELPFPVVPHQPKQMHINLALPGPFSERALSIEGEKNITVTFFTATGQTIYHNYCFNLDKDQSAEVLVSHDKNVLTPDCD